MSSRLANETWAIVNARVYTPNRLVAPDGVLLIRQGKILAVGRAQECAIPEHAVTYDMRGAIVCPGYVDVHVHGGAGADCTDGSVEAVRAMAAHLLTKGTTSFLPTTMSAPYDALWQAFDAISEVAVRRGAAESRVLGIHMEGPMFSPAQAGAQNPAVLRMPTRGELERLISYVPLLKRVDLAPELDGALDVVSYLAEAGVLVAGAHSDALYFQVCQAMDAGLLHTTHLWSAMSTVRRIGPQRYSGMVEASLVEDGLTTEIIADGYHLPSSLMKLAFKCKGSEKLCVVSDAIRAAGMPPGVYDLGGMDALVESNAGVAMTVDKKAFAGSISSISECVQHLVNGVGFALGDVLRMATLTPARIHGLDDTAGLLAPGRVADFLVLEPATLEPRAVFLDGVLVHGDARLWD